MFNIEGYGREAYDFLKGSKVYDISTDFYY